MEYFPLVSIIIPTYNSQKSVKRCVASVREQKYPGIELIVVDNNSTDSTREIVKGYGDIYIKGPERCSQRNFGASKAKGEYLFFIDSDMELEPEVVSDCVKEAIDDDKDAIVVPEVSVGEGFWAGCKALERSCYIGDDSIEAPRFFKKAAFFAVGGYDEGLLAAEDWDLSLRLKEKGFSFSRVDAVIKHHEGRLRLKDTIIKKYKYGKTIHKYIDKHKEESKKQFSLFRSSFLKNYQRLLASPFKGAGVMTMKMLEFSAGAIGMFMAKFFGKKNSSVDE